VRHNRWVLRDRAARWVADVIGPGSRITSARRLHPGGWHVNHAVAVADRHGHTHRLVLRRWARPGWEADDPDYTVEREARVLELLHPAPVPAPVVVAADPAGEHCDVPAILLTRLPGHPPRPADASDADGFCASSPKPSPSSTISPTPGLTFRATTSATTAHTPHPPDGCPAHQSGSGPPPRYANRPRQRP